MKLTAQQLLDKFPKLLKSDDNVDTLLEDMACPECGENSLFRIRFEGTAQVSDDTSEDDGDHDWNDESDCRCGFCEHAGRVKDFTYYGLSELIEEQQHN